MFNKLSLVGAALAMGAATLIPATPAMAQDRYYRDYDRGDRGDRYDRSDRGRDYYRDVDYRDYDRNYDRSDRGDRSYYRPARCKSSGTAGTIIGAVAGGLLGNQVVGRRGDQTVGTIIGAGVGALAGRAIDKSDSKCRR